MTQEQAVRWLQAYMWIYNVLAEADRRGSRTTIDNQQENPR